MPFFEPNCDEGNLGAGDSSQARLLEPHIDRVRRRRRRRQRKRWLGPDLRCVGVSLVLFVFWPSVGICDFSLAVDGLAS